MLNSPQPQTKALVHKILVHTFLKLLHLKNKKVVKAVKSNKSLFDLVFLIITIV